MDVEPGQESGRAASRSPDPGARPVILVLVKDTVGNLALLLPAAEIALARNARLHVAFISPPWLVQVGISGMTVPASLCAETDSLAAAMLREKVAGLLGLTTVEWTFRWARGEVRRSVTALLSDLSPTGVVMGAPRRRRLRLDRSVARWLIGRPNIPVIVIPA